MSQIRFFGAVLPITAIILSGLVASCQPEEEIRVENPTPEPTPESTPEPLILNDEFRMTSFAIAGEGIGCDLNGDGLVDNHLPEFFDIFYSVLYDAILSICENIPVYDDPNECLADAQALMEANNLIVDETTFNVWIESELENQSLIYLEHLSGPPESAVLSWYGGWLNSENQYVTISSLGEQPGAVDLARSWGEFGPGEFQFQLTSEFSLLLEEAYASFRYAGGDAPQMTEGTLCGAVTEDEIKRFTAELIPEYLSLYEDQIIEAVIQAMEELALFDVDVDGQSAFSSAFIFSADPEEIANIQ